MYRLLLADDEKIVVDSITMIIEKNFPDQFEIRAVRTGRGLIEQAAEFHPDVAIVDIHMPGINGINAIREIASEISNIIFIIMTAYDRFDYAKEAVKLGVLEYMNKPFNSRDIVEVMGKAIRLIETRREKRRENLRVREKMEQVTPIIENGFIFTMLFSGEHSGEELESYRELLEIETEYGSMMAVMIEEDDGSGQPQNIVGSGVRLQNYYAEVREKILGTFDRAIVGPVIANCIPVFLPSDTKKLDYESRISLINQGRALSVELKEETGCLCRIGIGSVQELKDSMVSYTEAMRALASAEGRAVHVDDLALSLRYEEEYSIDLENALFDALKSGDPENCEKAAGQFFDWMLTTYGQKNISVKLKALEFVLFADYVSYNSSGGRTYHFNERAEYLPLVYNAENNSDVRSWFIERFGAACRHMTSGKENYENGMIIKGRKYITENYDKDISLDDVSRHLNLSPYYFSKLFKSETGTTFVEYLTNLRMERAQELLKDESLSIKEICAAVGYADPNYFSRTFKKNVGVTPTVYREGSKNEE